MTKRTMTLNLSEREMVVLEELSSRNEMTKTQIMRRALRLYQLVDIKAHEGKSIVFSLLDGTLEKLEIFGCGDLS